MKRSVSIGIFIIICIFAWWKITDVVIQREPEQKAKARRYVELFMNDFVLTAMNETGKPAYRLHGTRLERYHNSPVTQVEKPVIYLLQQDPPWIITAEKAQLNSRKDTIRLIKNVVMEQQDSEPAMTIYTNMMLIHNKTQIATTKNHVRVEQGKSRLRSVGMTYNNRTNELELSSRVKGFYQPNE